MSSEIIESPLVRCVEIDGSDDRMDCREMFYDPLNPLPRKCTKCGFPDLDYVPQPYYLVKSRTMSPNELALAENGNFFVRPRIRSVLELLAPGQCTYFSTHYKRTSETTPWLLVVPNRQVITAEVDPSIPRCKLCREPASAHPGTQYCKSIVWPCESECEMLKSSTWASSELGWDKWLSRNFYLSVRLLHLLKKIKAKGFYESTCGKQATPNKDEKLWIAAALQSLEQNDIPLHPAGTLSDADAEWFRTYLDTHAARKVSPFDVKDLEKRLRLKLPKSYLEFVGRVGCQSFDNIDGQEGFTARILAPKDLDAVSFRAGKLEADDDETNAVDGLMFAATYHGDCFCFDVQKGKKEYPVFLYKHEYDSFEPYAENFAECIK